MFKLKCKAFDSPTGRARAEAAGVPPPSSGRGVPCGPGAGVTGRPAGRRLRAVQLHLVGAESLTSREADAARDRAGIFQWGRRLLKGPLSAGRRPARRVDRGTATPWGLGDHGCAPQRRASDHLGRIQREARSPYPPRGENCRQGGWGVRPSTHRMCAWVCLVLGPQGRSGRPWGLCVCASLCPARCRH